MSRAAKFKFRLYVADDTLNSAKALTNLTALCLAHLPNRYEIDVVDVFLEPGRALNDRVLMTPTLVKLTPSPVRKIVGTLSQPLNVLLALGIEPLAP